MKKFLAVYIGSDAGQKAANWESLDESARQEREQAGMAGWRDWVMAHQKSIVEMGSPLGSTKRVGPDGVSDIKNELVAYTVVQAESHEAAAKLFLDHPHFRIFPGDSVEIMECLPIPGQ